LQIHEAGEVEEYLLLQGLIPTWSAPSPPDTRSVSGYSKEQRTHKIVTLLQCSTMATISSAECHTDHHQLHTSYLFAEDALGDADGNTQMSSNHAAVCHGFCSDQRCIGWRIDAT